MVRSPPQHPASFPSSLPFCPHVVNSPALVLPSLRTSTVLRNSTFKKFSRIYFKMFEFVLGWDVQSQAWWALKSSLCSEIIQRRISKDFKVKLAKIRCQAIEFQFNSMPKYLKMSLIMYCIVSYNLSSRKVNKNKSASFCFSLIYCLKIQDV